MEARRSGTSQGGPQIFLDLPTQISSLKRMFSLASQEFSIRPDLGSRKKNVSWTILAFKKGSRNQELEVPNNVTDMY